MKADKKAIDRLSTFGKVAYYLGCFKYKEEYIEDSTEYPKKKVIRYSFMLRLWNPFSMMVILSLGIAAYRNEAATDGTILRDKEDINLDKKEFILCAAIKRKSPRIVARDLYNKNDILDIELGYRHYDILIRFSGYINRGRYDQGFYTSLGRFVDREEAARIAYDAGQIKEKKGTLYSEDLY